MRTVVVGRPCASTRLRRLRRGRHVRVARPGGMPAKAQPAAGHAALSPSRPRHPPAGQKPAKISRPAENGQKTAEAGRPAGPPRPAGLAAPPSQRGIQPLASASRHGSA